MGRILRSDGDTWTRNKPEGLPEIRPADLEGKTPEQQTAMYEDHFFRFSHLRIAINCPKHIWTMCRLCHGVPVSPPCAICAGTGQVRTNAIMVWGCRHVLEQDPVNPCGIVFTPKRYYVCQDCWRLIKSYKFNFQKEMQTTCWQCINDYAAKLFQKNSDLLLDLSQT